MNASSDSSKSFVSSPSIWIYPDDGVSRHPIKFIIVDFPEPDGPMIAVNEPRGIFNVTPSRALTT